MSEYQIVTRNGDPLWIPIPYRTNELVPPLTLCCHTPWNATGGVQRHHGAIFCRSLTTTYEDFQRYTWGPYLIAAIPQHGVPPIEAFQFLQQRGYQAMCVTEPGDCRDRASDKLIVTRSPTKPVWWGTITPRSRTATDLEQATLGIFASGQYHLAQDLWRAHGKVTQPLHGTHGVPAEGLRYPLNAEADAHTVYHIDF